NQNRKMRLGTSRTVATVQDILSQETLAFLAPISGFADRMFALGGFMALCDVLQKKMRMYWITNIYCNGKLTDNFDLNFECLEFEGKGFPDEEAIQEVLSQEPSTLFQFKPGWGAREIYRLFIGILIPEQISEEEFEIKAQRHLKALSLKKKLWNKIDEFRHVKLRPHPIGIHLRRTDMVRNTILPKYYLITKEQVHKLDALTWKLLKENAVPGTGFFLACDDLFYQEKVRKMLEEARCTVTVYATKDPKNLRQTSLQDAICDLYLLAHCDRILQCGPSGFSRLASQIGGTPVISVKTAPEWCAKIQHWCGLLRRTCWLRRPWTAFIEKKICR
nr:hypothetical protein [Candidatus Peribacteraceae bacterium]